jgi:digeranylgeranylglycerophospholipid reductase
VKGLASVDVLVVGLGPAGARAAATAARGGTKVLGVERKKEVGIPVQCAEFVPLPLSGYANANGVLTQRVAEMASLLPSGTCQRSLAPGLMVDRAAFDAALVRDAQHCGAAVSLATRVVDVDAKRSIATLSARGQQVEIGYRILIAADGPHSTVGEKLGLPVLDTVHTRQYTVPLRQPYSDTDVWLSDAYPGGYAWLFPKGAVANLGLGLHKRHTRNLKQALDRLHKTMVEEGRVGSDVVFRTGGAIPVGGLRDGLAVGNVLFVGDAAGLTHPITGAGIAAAVASGERAGEAAADCLVRGRSDALADFELEIREQYEKTLKRAVERRRWLQQNWASSQPDRDAQYRKAWVAFPEYFAPL